MKKYIYFSLILLSYILLANDKAYPQDACNPENPNYCSECRDESKRDFKRCDENDYRGVSLHTLKRTYIHKDERFPYPFFGIDYDPYTKKAVYCADIGREGVKLEIFVVDAHQEGRKLIINDLNKKRVTWDSVSNLIFNKDPFWTKDRRIVLEAGKIGDKSTSEYIINTDGGNKTMISPDEFARLCLEAHDRNTGIVNVPPSN